MTARLVAVVGLALVAVAIGYGVASWLDHAWSVVIGGAQWH